MTDQITRKEAQESIQLLRDGVVALIRILPSLAPVFLNALRQIEEETAQYLKQNKL